MTDVDVVRHFAESHWWKLTVVVIGPDSNKIGRYNVRLTYQKLHGLSHCELNFQGLDKDQLLDMQTVTNSWKVLL